MSTPARILMVTGDTEPSAPAAGQILLYAKTDGVFYSKNSSNVEHPLAGTVASVNASGGTTGMAFTGGPITGTGTLTLSGVLGVSNGGTGSTSQAGAAAAILPSQTGNAGRFLTTDGTNVSWAVVSGTGTVTSVGVSSGNSAISVTGSPITTSGSITVTANTFTSANPGVVPGSGGGTTNFLRADGTWAAPPTSPGTVTSVSVNGSSGRITSTGSPITSSGSITLDLATTAVTAGTYGSGTQVPVFTVDAYGRITGVTNTTITSGGTGTVTSVSATAGTGISITGSPITTSGTLTITNTGVTSFSGGTTGLTPNTATTGAVTLGGTLAIANGGTGATAAPAARTNLGATTIGSNIFTAINPGAITFLRANADNTVSFLDAATFRTAIGAGAGTVTSVGLSSANNAITISGSPVTSSGSITVTANNFTSSSPGVVPASGGGTTNFLRADGTWAAPPGAGGSGTVTSVSATGNNGITISGSPITTSGTLTLGLGAITPTSVAATGTVTGSNLSGTNTGDQTITLTGDVTGSGTSSFAATLSNTGVSAGTYGSATQVPVFTVDAKGRISSVTNTAISAGGSSAPEIVVFRYSSGGSGNFNSGDNIFSQTSGVTATITDGANCIVTYSFTGKSNPPKSILIYAQVYATNEFVLVDTTSLPSANRKIAGGGTAASPDLANGIFTSSNIVTLQTRMSDTGASAGLGQRAHLLVVFGF